MKINLLLLFIAYFAFNFTYSNNPILVNESTIMLDLDQSEKLYFSFEEGDDYRNILIVLTDGYIYHKDTKIMEGNRSSYLTPQLVKELKLNDKDWKGNIENREFGFISTGMDLSNLEVLVLGINPSKNNPYEEDVIMKYWRDWLEDMKVKRCEIKTAELPSNMDKIIKEFILN